MGGLEGLKVVEGEGTTSVQLRDRTGRVAGWL